MNDRELKAATTGIIIYEYIRQTGKEPDFEDDIAEAIVFLDDVILERTLEICSATDPDFLELEEVDPDSPEDDI